MLILLLCIKFWAALSFIIDLPDQIDLDCGELRATNHGQYVSCVAHVTREVVRYGQISR